MKKLITLLTVTLIATAGIFAQVGEIKGTIKDEKAGETIPGATIYIEVGGNKRGDASNMDGKYTINPVNVGTHTVYISALGYKITKVKNVLITSDKITYVNAEMVIAPTELDMFSVVEKMHKIPLITPDEPSAQHILPKEFNRNVNRNNPILAITGMTAGLTLAPNGKDVMIRGSRPISTQFITDGVKSITGKIGIPGLAIGSVKVYTSGVPAKYGDVTGGVIVVETKSYFDLVQLFK
ncbi:MAG: carboxypeptidase-like regulatory domain-containing protein [Flavobacteriales bacterium]|nr:carboxypeptidase-like regulatory domain-containing protein [Flavobacteriales bacterium]